MNQWKLYSAIQHTERALSHLRSAWQQNDGGWIKDKSEKQIIAEVKFAAAQLEKAGVAATDSIAGSIPEEPKTEE